jgi:hypothetical protein
VEGREASGVGERGRAGGEVVAVGVAVAVAREWVTGGAATGGWLNLSRPPVRDDPRRQPGRDDGTSP